MQLKKTRKSRGSVLLLTFFLLIILAILGTGFVALLPVELRSAQRDRSVVQSTYGADAAVLSVMNDLYAGVKADQIVVGTQTTMANGWTYSVEEVEKMGLELFRVTTSSSLHGKVQRRAVAIIDDGSGTEAVKNTANVVDGDSVGAWPATVPIKGDILWMGTWNVDNAGYNMNNAGNPPFQGTIFQTKQNGSALRQESYTSGNPTAAQYPNLYSSGMAAIQPSYQLSEDDLLNSTDSQKDMLGYVFGTTDGNAALAAASAVPASSVKVTKSGTAMTGGIYINDDNGNVNSNGPSANKRRFKVEFTAPSAGIGRMMVTRDDGAMSVEIVTIEAGAPLPMGIAGASTSTQDRIFVKSGATTELLTTDIDAGHVVYIDGEITGMKGTFRGNRTIASTGDVAISGELLKADTPRGQEPTSASKDTLGIVGTVKAPNNSVGTNIKIPNGSVPTDNTYYLYCYLTGLDGNDTNNKLFKESSIPNGTKVHLMGSLQFAPSNGGLMGHTMGFVKGAFKQVTVDPLRPFGFPGAGRFVPRLRAYVDIPVEL